MFHFTAHTINHQYSYRLEAHYCIYQWGYGQCTVNLESIALVKFLRFFNVKPWTQLKFAMISAATLYSWHSMLPPIRKVRKIRFSVNSQNLLSTIFCESTVFTSWPTLIVSINWPSVCIH